jgi:hypothetical protein
MGNWQSADQYPPKISYSYRCNKRQRARVSDKPKVADCRLKSTSKVCTQLLLFLENATTDMAFAFVIANEVDAIEVPLLLHEAAHDQHGPRNE